MATVTLTASIYAPYSTTASISNPSRAYTDTSSTTYATITSSTNSTASRIYFYGFDFSQIPEGAVVTSMEFKIKISTTTSGTRYVSALYNRSTNSTISSSVQSSTSAQVKTLTLTSLSYDDVIALGNSFAFGVTTYSTSVSQYVYGMEIDVTYEIPVPPPDPVPNKVDYIKDGVLKTLIDLTGDDTLPEDVTAGKIFHLADGRQAVGTGGGLEYETGTWSPSTASTHPTISFSGTHTDPPFFVALMINDISASVANSTGMGFVGYNMHRLFNVGSSNATTAEYHGCLAYTRWNYKKSNGDIANDYYAVNSPYGTSTSTKGNWAYWATNTSFMPENTMSYKTSIVYKWVAIWSDITLT